jgi:hypothetical protein
MISEYAAIVADIARAMETKKRCMFRRRSTAVCYKNPKIKVGFLYLELGAVRRLSLLSSFDIFGPD